jgi:hypothetical protein
MDLAKQEGLPPWAQERLGALAVLWLSIGYHVIMQEIRSDAHLDSRIKSLMKGIVRALKNMSGK